MFNFEYEVQVMLDSLAQSRMAYELDQEQAKETMGKYRKYKDAQSYTEASLYWNAEAAEAEADYCKDKVQDALDALREAYKAIKALKDKGII